MEVGCLAGGHLAMPLEGTGRTGMWAGHTGVEVEAGHTGMWVGHIGVWEWHTGLWGMGLSASVD